VSTLIASAERWPEFDDQKLGRRAEAMVNRLAAGDPISQGEASRLFDGASDADKARLVVVFGGDYRRNAEGTAIKAWTGDDLPVIRVATGCKLELLRRELAGPNPSPIETLLAERAAWCWLVVYEKERMHQAKGGSLRDEIRRERIIGMAHARFLSAIKALADVRRVPVANVQVLVARATVAATPAVPGAPDPLALTEDASAAVPGVPGTQTASVAS